MTGPQCGGSSAALPLQSLNCRPVAQVPHLNSTSWMALIYISCRSAQTLAPGCFPAQIRGRPLARPHQSAGGLQYLLNAHAALQLTSCLNFGSGRKIQTKNELNGKAVPCARPVCSEGPELFVSGANDQFVLNPESQSLSRSRSRPGCSSLCGLPCPQGSVGPPGDRARSSPPSAQGKHMHKASAWEGGKRYAALN